MNMVRNWGYVQSDEDIGELYITKNQYMGGNMAGIIVNPDNCYKQIGDICNAKTFKFPVRYELLDITHANNVEQELNRIIKKFETEGCRFVASTGGEFGSYQKQAANMTELPVIMTPLMMLPLCNITLSSKKKIMIISENNMDLTFDIIKENSFADIKNIEFCKIDENQKIINSMGGQPNFENVGTVIWDSPKKCNIKDIPVYGMCDAIYFMHSAVAQKPYEGFL